MTIRQDFSRCPYCGEPFDDGTHEKEGAHIIPRKRGGCEHTANLVDACKECNRGEGGQWELTPIEWWAEQEWKVEDTENGVSAFDWGGWTLVERQEMLLQCAYWEARARWHLFTVHGVKASFEH